MARCGLGRLFGSLFSGGGDQLIGAEVGVLKEVRRSQIAADRFLLIMEYRETEYCGILLFSTQDFCDHLYEWMKNHVGWKIKDIAGVDVTNEL
jgi:hypothetical protein